MYLGFMHIGLTEILLITAIILLVFGTSRFGQLKNSVTKAAKNFRKSIKGGSEE